MNPEQVHVEREEGLGQLGVAHQRRQRVAGAGNITAAAGQHARQGGLGALVPLLVR
ncbi:hypothetical protein [Frankia sp. AgB32]|uniref:hypothetical protein n=1 Tax=Frankia sp. AgB32 TaxID=631119 RepID=UPI00200E120D|nr:hypothetical protein [Frankia sp. AgB32]MCK9898236.1 hypothetical protein [Frankia sp. AgB32]